MRQLCVCTFALLSAAVATSAADYHFGADISGMTPGNNGARGFFDAGGNTLPVFDVFHRYTRPIHRTDGQ
jgi:hypothetical protein